MTWRFRQIIPQAARGRLRDEMWDSVEWVAEEKYDGDRRIAQVCGAIARFTGRRVGVGGSLVEKTANLPHLNKVPLALDGTVLDGEVVVPAGHGGAGGQSKYVTSIMGSSPGEARRKQLSRGWLRYAVFDCLWFRGEDVRARSLRERRNFAAQAVKLWPRVDVFMAGQAAGVGKRDLYDRVVRGGGEGVVLKRALSAYGDPREWVKVKAEWTADVVVLGFVDAEAESTKVGGEVSPTKYAGGVGSARFGQYRDGKLVELGSCSGFDDATRGEMTRNPRYWVGRVIEIRHNGREPSGAFRHPRFSRVRDDKRAAECLFDESEK